LKITLSKRRNNMAIRTIRIEGDPILNKVCKPIKDFDKKLKELAEDMIETMYDANGVGLAAPQIGVLKRIFVIDVSEEGDNPICFINPEILETSGSQTGEEGCLSIPGKQGIVTRPNYVKVRAYDTDMNQFELEGEGLMARAILHENDHLNGHLYTEKVIGPLKDLRLENMN